MIFVRSAFIAAFMMIAVGSLAARSVVEPWFHRGSAAPSSHVAAVVATPSFTATPPPPTSTATHAAVRTRTPTPISSVTPVPPATATASRIPRVTPRGRHRAPPKVSRHRRRATTKPTSTPTPAVTPTPGILALERYWIGSLSAKAGHTIEIGYVIDNATGRTERLVLGASVKSSQALSWATAAISDPGHDVVAVVRPGISTHIRFFTLPRGLHAGPYDVAWGLRDPATGVRAALVFASGVLRVRR